MQSNLLNRVVKKLQIKLRFSERTRKILRNLSLSFHVSLFELAFTEYMNFYKDMSQSRHSEEAEKFKEKLGSHFFYKCLFEV